MKEYDAFYLGKDEKKIYLTFDEGGNDKTYIKEITDILSRIIYNKNLILDKKILTPEQDKPEFNIYIANDYGFCGNFNSEVSRRIKKDN